MKAPRPPLFLEREGYRRRRLMDAARVLPVLGALLFLLPLLWAPQTTPETDTGAGGLYVFAVWLGLILGAFALSRRLGREGRVTPADKAADASAAAETGEGG